MCCFEELCWLSEIFFVAGNVIKKSTNRDRTMLNTLIKNPLFQKKQKGNGEIERWAAFANVKMF